MLSHPKVEQSELPPASQLSSSYGAADFADAFSVDLPQSASHDIEALARHVFANQPAWIATLLGIRDTLVRPLGLKTTADFKEKGGDRISAFRVFERSGDEIVLGEDDAHLDFRVSIILQPSSNGRSRLTLTTLVFYNRPLGRAYIAVIAPFHRLVVRASLHRAQQLGWPNA